MNEVTVAPTRGDEVVSLDAGGSGRGRGRPTVVDPIAIASQAVRLWIERGYHETGWKDLVEATGVSQRTLLRHFGSKADLAWFGVSAAEERLREGLAMATDDTPTWEAVRNAVAHSVGNSPRLLARVPDWIALIDSVPELRAAAPRMYEPWLQTLANFLVERRPDLSFRMARVMAQAYEAGSHEALVEWVAAGGYGDPRPLVRQVLEVLEFKGFDEPQA